MTQTVDSIIKQRIQRLEDNTFIPEDIEEEYNKLFDLIKDNPEAEIALSNILNGWKEELLQSYQCVDRLQTTVNQYENELVMLMDQMDALVKCSLLIKQYSIYLKQEIDKVADKIDKQGFDERLDHLVDLLEEIKPKKHLNVVRDTTILEFPKKQ